MTPIELNGKVFCSNCGLTIANNGQTTANTPQPTINQSPNTVSDLVTEAPEEIEFPIVPEVITSEKSKISEDIHSEPIIPNFEETEAAKAPETPLIDYFGQFVGKETDTADKPIGRKLEVMTDVPASDTTPPMPITEETMKDLGITPEVPMPKPEEPILESKISDLSIPTEEDFANETPVSADIPIEQSYMELKNPGNEKETLETSGILLDILGEEGNDTTDATAPAIPAAAGISLDLRDKQEYESEKILDPVAEPEIPAETETNKNDDIYTLPSEIKVGIRNKKVSKEMTISDNLSSSDEANLPRGKAGDADILRQAQNDTEIAVDPKTESKIEKLEEKIAGAPEPIVDLTPDDAKQYDPDTIDPHNIDPDTEKSKVIKEYFSTAIERDKETHKSKIKKKKQIKSLKIFIYFAAAVIVLVILSVGGIFIYGRYKPTAAVVQKVAETSTFTTVSPSYIPEGYVLETSNYSDSAKTFEMVYKFTSDKTKTITFKQVKTDNSKKFISDYISSANTNFAVKVIDGTTFTEADGLNLLWSNDDFVFVIETQNFTFSNDLLYKMAGTVSI